MQSVNLWVCCLCTHFHNIYFRKTTSFTSHDSACCNKLCQNVGTFNTDTTNAVLHCEICIHIFPEELYEHLEVSHIGNHLNNSTSIPHFADVIFSMETV